MSKRFLSVLWICLVAAVVTTAKTDVKTKLERTNRIFNGNNTLIEKVPFIVQIRARKVGTICGGTLISTQHVLTAAHCFDSPYNITKELTVVAGATARSETGVQRQIASLTKHPEYEVFYIAKGTDDEEMVGSKADVAIIKLDKPFTETKQIKVKKDLCSEPPSVGEFADVYGWGHTQPVDPTSDEDIEYVFPKQLQSARLKIVSNEVCSRTLSADRFRLSKTNICASSWEQDPCEGDSGGPLIFHRKLCAVVSYGVGCAFEDYPSIYTSIHSVKQFIDKQLKA